MGTPKPHRCTRTLTRPIEANLVPLCRPHQAVGAPAMGHRAELPPCAVTAPASSHMGSGTELGGKGHTCAWGGPSYHGTRRLCSPSRQASPGPGCLSAPAPGPTALGAGGPPLCPPHDRVGAP